MIMLPDVHVRGLTEEEIVEHGDPSASENHFFFFKRYIVLDPSEYTNGVYDGEYGITLFGTLYTIEAAL